MRETFDFAIPKRISIKTENVQGLLFDIDALTTGGAVCDIADLNKIRMDLTLKSPNRKEPLVIHKGFLQDFLNILYQQSTKLELVQKKLSSGYKIFIDFEQYPIFAKLGSELIIECEFPTSAFTSSSKATSSVSFESIISDSNTPSRMINIYEQFVPDAGQSSLDKNIGGNIQAILLRVDQTATFDTSTKAKPVSVDILANNNFVKNLSQNALIYLNSQMLHYNPATSVRNLWLYNSLDTLLQGATLRATFDKAVDSSSLVQVKRVVLV